MSKGRLEAFSDGVFGVAITLLILDVRPEGGGTGWDMLLHQWHHIFVFLLSFVIVGVRWVIHHHITYFITGTDRVLLWLNLLVLLFIVFIPYVATLLSATHEDAASIRIYAVTLILVNLSGNIFWLYATWHHRLVSPALPEPFIRFVLFLRCAPILVYSVAIAVAAWLPGLSLALFVVEPVFYILPNPWLERHLHEVQKAVRAHEKKHKPELE